MTLHAGFCVLAPRPPRLSFADGGTPPLSDKNATKKPREKKPTNPEPWTVRVDVAGRVALANIPGDEAKTVEKALAAAIKLRGEFESTLEATKIGDDAPLYVRSVSVSRGRGTRAADHAEHPEPAPALSPARQLYLIFARSLSSSVRNSDRKTDGSLGGLVNLMIEAGVHFDKDDLRGKNAIGYGHYSEAVKYGNTSYCQAIETKEGRPPFFFDGRVFCGKILEWPIGNWRETAAKWPAGATASWDGARCTVTSFGMESDGTHYVIACSYRSEGKVIRYQSNPEATIRAEEKIKRRYKITHAELQFLEKARDEGTRREALASELVTSLRRRDVTVSRDVILAAGPSQVKAMLLTWPSWKMATPEIEALVAHEARLVEVEPLRRQLAEYHVGLSSLVIAEWTDAQREAIVAWAAGNDYALPTTGAGAGLLTAENERARAVSASRDVIEALRVAAPGNLFFEAWKEPVSREALPRIANEMDPNDLAFLLSLARQYAASEDKIVTSKAMVLGDEVKRVLAVVREIARAVGWEQRVDTEEEDEPIDVAAGDDTDDEEP